jgi:hypothetical protein
VRLTKTETITPLNFNLVVKVWRTQQHVWQKSKEQKEHASLSGSGCSEVAFRAHMHEPRVASVLEQGLPTAWVVIIILYRQIVIALEAG